LLNRISSKNLNPSAGMPLKAMKTSAGNQNIDG
jgi:hypothetical protein